MIIKKHLNIFLFFFLSMNFLATYIDFSIKYKLLVGNNLNEDIRVYIWNIYKTLIAKDIL